MPALGLRWRQISLALDLLDGALGNGGAGKGAVVGQLQGQGVGAKVGRFKLQAGLQARVGDAQPEKSHLPLASPRCIGQRLVYEGGRGRCVRCRYARARAGNSHPHGHRCGQHADSRQVNQW